MAWRFEGSTGRPRGRLGAGLGGLDWPLSACAGVANVVHSWCRRVTANRLAGRQLVLCGWDLLHRLCAGDVWGAPEHAFGSPDRSCGCCMVRVGRFTGCRNLAGFNRAELVSRIELAHDLWLYSYLVATPSRLVFFV